MRRSRERVCKPCTLDAWGPVCSHVSDTIKTKITTKHAELFFLLVTHALGRGR